MQSDSGLPPALTLYIWQNCERTLYMQSLFRIIYVDIGELPYTLSKMSLLTFSRLLVYGDAIFLRLAHRFCDVWLV